MLFFLKPNASIRTYYQHLKWIVASFISWKNSIYTKKIVLLVTIPKMKINADREQLIEIQIKNVNIWGVEAYSVFFFLRNKVDNTNIWHNSPESHTAQRTAVHKVFHLNIKMCCKQNFSTEPKHTLAEAAAAALLFTHSVNRSVVAQRFSAYFNAYCV